MGIDFLALAANGGLCYIDSGLGVGYEYVSSVKFVNFLKLGHNKTAKDLDVGTGTCLVFLFVSNIIKKYDDIKPT